MNSIITLFLAILGAVIATFICSEIQAWSPYCIEIIIRFSSERVLFKSVRMKLNKQGKPQGEEMYCWYKSTIHETQGKEITKLVMALSSIYAAIKMDRDHLKSEYSKKLTSNSLRTIIISTLLIISALALAAGAYTPVLNNDKSLDQPLTPEPQLTPSLPEKVLIFAEALTFELASSVMHNKNSFDAISNSINNDEAEKRSPREDRKYLILSDGTVNNVPPLNQPLLEKYPSGKENDLEELEPGIAIPTSLLVIAEISTGFIGLQGFYASLLMITLSIITLFIMLYLVTALFIRSGVTLQLFKLCRELSISIFLSVRPSFHKQVMNRLLIDLEDHQQMVIIKRESKATIVRVAIKYHVICGLITDMIYEMPGIFQNQQSMIIHANVGVIRNATLSDNLMARTLAIKKEVFIDNQTVFMNRTYKRREYHCQVLKRVWLLLFNDIISIPKTLFIITYELVFHMLNFYLRK
jgi:hypothetical protein